MHGLFSVKYVWVHLHEMFTTMPRVLPQWPYLAPSLFAMAIWIATPALILMLRAPLTRLTFASAIAALFIAAPNLMHGGNGFTQFGYRHTLDFLPFLLILIASGMREHVGRDRRRADPGEHRRERLGRHHPERPRDRGLLTPHHRLAGAVPFVYSSGTGAGNGPHRRGRGRSEELSSELHRGSARRRRGWPSRRATEREAVEDTQGTVEPDWSLGAPDGGDRADAGTPPPGVEPGQYSPDAKWETYRALAEDLTAPAIRATAAARRG